MSTTPDPSPLSSDRTGRVSRVPLVIVLMVLILVVVAGVLISNKSRADRDEPVAENSTTTTTSVSASPSSSSTSTSAAVGTSGPLAPGLEATTTAPSTTATPPGGGDCTADAFRASIKASGQVDAAIAEQFQVSSFKCVDPYARAYVKAPGADAATAYFVRSGGVWRMLVLGTSVDPITAGVPDSVAMQLES